jgi:uncharacterized protein YjbI with pentapeptide repeats
MARPWIRQIGRIAIATVVVIVAAGALMWTAWFWWKRLLLPLNSQMVVASVVPAVLLLAAVWWVWWRLPRRQVRRLDIQIHDPKARADTEDNFRKTVGQALGGAAVLIGAVIAYLQFTQQQQASHDLLISNQVSKGFEQLASDKITERLGGVYALEGVMNTSSQYQEPVLEALCAFVRENTRPQRGPLTILFEALFAVSRDDAKVTSRDEPLDDIQAALTVIARRKAGSSGVVDLFRARIPFAVLSGADLSSALLLYTNLSYAFLIRTNLSGADLLRTNLSGADLTEANLSGARNLTQDQLDQACGKPEALPPGLSLDKPCPP